MADEAVHVEWNGDELSAAIRGASLEGMQFAAEHLLQVATGLVPLEEGTLSRSGEVSTDGTTRQVAVSYDTPYAVVQHEEMTWHHADGRQAKYLEDPMHSEHDTMLELIASKPRGLLG